MRPFVIDPAALPAGSHDLVGAVVTHEVRIPGGGRIRKGRVLTAADLPLLERLDRAIHAVRLDSGDVHEDDAARRLANIAMGPGLIAREPVQSRVNMVAAAKGLLRVDAEAVLEINRHAPAGLFTMLDRQPVVAGKIVAGSKIATVAIGEDVLARIADLVAARGRPVLEVKPYLPHCVGVVVTEGLADKVRERFEAAVRAKVSWYGSRVLRFAYVANDAAAVVAALERMLADGATMLFTAGGNMMDPLDASLQAIPALGATVVRLGAPAHPGSMFWMGEIAGSATPIVNLASWSMYSKATVADLVLPWAMAGEPVTADDLATLGYGGLLDRDMGWRFPAYDVDAVDEPDEV